MPIPRETPEGYVDIPPAIRFFRFERCPTVDLVFIMPPECNICTMQCLESGEEYWKFGTPLDIIGFLIENPRYTRTCPECEFYAHLEREWRVDRFWTYIVRQMRRRELTRMIAFIIMTPNSETSTLVRPAELPSISAGKQPGSTTPVYSSSSRRDSSTMHEIDDYESIEDDAGWPLNLTDGS